MTTHTTRAAIVTARNAAGKPYEMDAYRAAQKALQTELDWMTTNGTPHAVAIAALCHQYGVEMSRYDVWIVD